MQNVQEELNLDYQVPETQTPVEDAILARWSTDAPEEEPSPDESEEAAADELPEEEEEQPELELEELDEASKMWMKPMTWTMRRKMSRILIAISISLTKLKLSLLSLAKRIRAPSVNSSGSRAGSVSHSQESRTCSTT